MQIRHLMAEAEHELIVAFDAGQPSGPS